MWSLLGFLVLVVGGGGALGVRFLPGPWYAALAQPVFTPPNWVFGPVWTLLYVLIALAGWRFWRASRASRAMRLWWVQLALNFLWSPVFFGAQRIDLALAVVLLLLLAAIAVLREAWASDRIAVWCLAPYVAWVGFASLLNAAFFALN